MRYEVLTRTQIHPLLPETATPIRLRAYVQDRLDLLSDDGRRWAVLILPGGGYGLTSPNEGERVALSFLAAGIPAFVLDYSVAPVRYPSALLEAAAALSFIRRHAAGYGVDPHRIAVCGFSAGGHLAGCLSNLHGCPDAWAPLGLSPQEIRPDAAIFCYSVLTAQPGRCHPGSFENLLGPGAEVPPFLSLEQSVTQHNPPSFLWCTGTDPSVPCDSTLLYAAALREKGIPFELHLYARGPHAMILGTRETAGDASKQDPHVSTWHPLCLEWLRSLETPNP